MEKLLKTGDIVEEGLYEERDANGDFVRQFTCKGALPKGVGFVLIRLHSEPAQQVIVKTPNGGLPEPEK